MLYRVRELISIKLENLNLFFPAMYNFLNLFKIKIYLFYFSYWGNIQFQISKKLKFEFLLQEYFQFLVFKMSEKFSQSSNNFSFSLYKSISKEKSKTLF